MKPDRVPEPIIKRKQVKTFHPSADLEMKRKAKEYGYNERYTDIIGEGQELVKDGHKPVAFDTNKTRRNMVKPTVKGTYK